MTFVGCDLHSQGGRILARGRPARQGPERAGAVSGRRENRPPRVGGQTGTAAAGGRRDRRRGFHEDVASSPTVGTSGRPELPPRPPPRVRGTDASDAARRGPARRRWRQERGMRPTMRRGSPKPSLLRAGWVGDTTPCECAADFAQHGPRPRRVARPRAECPRPRGAFVHAIRAECLNRLILFGERRLRRASMRPGVLTSGAELSGARQRGPVGPPDRPRPSKRRSFAGTARAISDSSEPPTGSPPQAPGEPRSRTAHLAPEAGRR
jgi:hypothetical protein